MPDTHRLLVLALQGLEAERARIDSEISELKSQLGGTSTIVLEGCRSGSGESGQ